METAKGFKNFLTTCAAWGMDIAALLISAIPSALRFRVERLVGWGYGSFSKQQKIDLQLNLKMLLNLDGKERSRTTNEIFKNFAVTLYDFFTPDGITVDVPDRPKLEALRANGKGVMMLTFHMGNWELGARTMSQWGWPVTAVYQPYQNKKFKNVIEKRRAPGVNFVPVGRKAADGVRDALQRGDVVAMLGDLPFGEQGIPVKILGHTVRWPKGPVVLAVKEQVPIVVAIVVRTAPRHYRAYVEEALVPKGKSREEIDRLVQEVANKFSTLVTRYPTQWYRFKAFDYIDNLSTAFSLPKRVGREKKES